MYGKKGGGGDVYVYGGGYGGNVYGVYGGEEEGSGEGGLF